MPVLIMLTARPQPKESKVDSGMNSVEYKEFYFIQLVVLESFKYKPTTRYTGSS
jgi:hypothetical protein